MSAGRGPVGDPSTLHRRWPLSRVPAGLWRLRVCLTPIGRFTARKASRRHRIGRKVFLQDPEHWSIYSRTGAATGPGRRIPWWWPYRKFLKLGDRVGGNLIHKGGQKVAFVVVVGWWWWSTGPRRAFPAQVPRDGCRYLEGCL